MKKSILAAFAAALTLISVAAPVFAQTTPRVHGGGKLKKLSNELQLSDAQKGQLRPILLAAHQQSQTIKADTSLTPDVRKAKLEELGRSTRQQMKAILTPEQREKLKAIRQAHRNQNHPNA